jgi:SAM-dependent MidA family methyltransferase
MTVAAFMDLALYDPEAGYYARAPQRSGRAGDFFTSVDVGPLFGELLEVQVAQMADILNSEFESQSVDLVEAGAGNGRLAADILRAARRRDPDLYDRVRLHLVDASPLARAAQRETLAEMADRLAASSTELPDRFEGVLVANELLDALPVHQVVMRRDGLREVYVDADLRIVEGPPSTPALSAYLERAGVTLEDGWRAEINLRALEWVDDAARRLSRGFMLLFDYGHEARDLYSASHATGTLTTFSGHTTAGPESGGPFDGTQGRPAWLKRPGEQDITAHVDFTSVRAAAEAAGLTTIALLDQTYFLLGIVGSLESQGSVGSVGSLGSLGSTGSRGSARALRTLVMPGGLGSTHKVLILGKDVGTPALVGCSFKVRMT